MKIDSDKDIFLAPGAQVIGNVNIGENVGIWYNAVEIWKELQLEIIQTCRTIVLYIQETDLHLQ